MPSRSPNPERLRFRTACVCAAIALSLAFAPVTAARALDPDDGSAVTSGGGEIVGFPFRIGIFGGWHFTSADIDIAGEREADLVPGAGPHVGLRLGWRAFEGFALEAEVGLVFVSVERDDAAAKLLPAHLSLVWRPTEAADITPVIGLGAGLMAQLPGPAGSDVDLLLSAAAGVEMRLFGPVSVRVTGGVFATDGVAAAMSWTPVVSLGLDVRTFSDRRASTAAPPDPEPDGPLPVRFEPKKVVPVPTDCPKRTPERLCVDTDGDGIIDAFDACPTAKGEVVLAGCGDTDGDGVADPLDACPDTKGDPARWGCTAPR